MEADVEDLQKQLMATLLPFQVRNAALCSHMLTKIGVCAYSMLLVDHHGTNDRDMLACRGHLRQFAFSPEFRLTHCTAPNGENKESSCPSWQCRSG